MIWSSTNHGVRRIPHNKTPKDNRWMEKGGGRWAHCDGHRWWLCVAVVMALLVLWIGNRCLLLWPLEGRRSARLHEYTFETGDLLLFSGAGLFGPLGAAALKLLGGSPYTHVGAVYRDPSSSHLYVWEMRAGLDNGGEGAGARLSSLYAALSDYAGQVVVRPVGRRIDVRMFERFVRERWGQGYAYSFYLNGYERCFEHHPPLAPTPRRTAGSPRFCADLIAETYEALGVLRYDGWPVPASSALPRDFAQASERLPYAPGWRFGDEIVLRP